MKIPIAVTPPFDLSRSLDFLRRFPPCRDDYVIEDDRVTAALAMGGRAVPFTIAAAPAPAAGFTVEVDDDLGPTAAALVAERARQWLSADDDLASFYAAADGDHPAYRALVAARRGLHHVRFLTLADIAVHAVLMQRAPIVQAARLRRRFVEHLGHPVVVRGVTLRAFPELDTVCALDVADFAVALRHPGKAAVLPGVVRGVAALGEGFLRAAPYFEAHAALTAIRGIGPFSAAAILLRGLGRMDDAPIESPQFAGPARAVYGGAFDPAAIRRRYGCDLGHWSFYLRASAGDAHGATISGYSAPDRFARSR